jgi:hypothetical protein
MFLCFSEEWKGSSSGSSRGRRGIKSKSYTQRKRMVMPDAIRVPNNNKAIHHLQYVMLFVASHSALWLFFCFFPPLFRLLLVDSMLCAARYVCLFFLSPLLTHSIDKFPTLFNREGFAALLCSAPAMFPQHFAALMVLSVLGQR